MSLGRALNDAEVTEFLALEKQHPLSAHLRTGDEILAALLKSLLAGQHIYTYDAEKPRPSEMLKENKKWLEEHFTVGEHESKGAWHLPQEDCLEVGRINFPSYLTTHPRHAMSIASDQRATVSLREPAYFYGYTILEPIADVYYMPFKLRSMLLTEKQQSEIKSLWDECAENLSVLGLPGEAIIREFQQSIEWKKATMEQVLYARDLMKQHLSFCLASGEAIGRFRAYKIKQLLKAYYAKFKKEPPLMRRVMTKAFYTTLAGYFGSDWLLFLDFTGESPSPDEQLAKALPEPRIFAGVANAGIKEGFAAPVGIPKTEIDKILSSFFNLSPDQKKSPVEERFDAINHYWQELMAMQNRQRPGMQPLWGLVMESEDFYLPQDPQDYGRLSLPDPWLYQKAFPKDVLIQIEDLWGTCVISQNPSTIVSAIEPYGLFCLTLGPALQLWHGLALTAWYSTEGPRSRTSVSNLSDYYRRELAALKELGTPISRELFEELSKEDESLGPAETTYEETGRESGITFSVSTGTYRKGFERLQRIISRHMKAWSDSLLHKYIEQSWRTTVTQGIEQYNRVYEQKAKKPTVKQCFKFFQDPANRWYGGNLSNLYHAFAEKIETQSHRSEILIARIREKEQFAWDVYTSLGARRISWHQLAQTIVNGDQTKQDAEQRKNEACRRLAELSFNYLQITEAIGKQPTLKDVGSKFKPHLLELDSNIDAAWEKYLNAIDQVAKKYGVLLN